MDIRKDWYEEMIEQQVSRLAGISGFALGLVLGILSVYLHAIRGAFVFVSICRLFASPKSK